MTEQQKFTVYSLRVGFRQWITTDIIEMTRFAIFMRELGHADAIGESIHEIELSVF